MTLTAADLVVGHRGAALLRAGNLRFGPGTVTAVLGPNGVGKSTLLRTLAGLHPAISGSVALDSRTLAAMPRSERARSLAFVAQEEAAAFPVTVREAVAVGRLPHSAGLRESPADAAAIQAAIERVDLASEGDTLLERLSGGQRRRATIARALAQEAAVVLLDEPLAHLDPSHTDEILRTLDELRRLDRTVVATFHEVDAALAVADRVILLSQGSVTFYGAPAELQDADLESVYGIAFARFSSSLGVSRRPVWTVRQ